MKSIIPDGEWHYTLKEIKNSTIFVKYRKGKLEKPKQPEIVFKSVCYLDVKYAWGGDQFTDRTEEYQQLLASLNVGNTHKVYVSERSDGPDMKIIATGYELSPYTPVE